MSDETASQRLRRLHDALSLLRPFDIVGHDKIRLGPSADGGHVLLDLDLPPTRAITLTNGDGVTFEVALARQGCSCLLVNHPAADRSARHPGLRFVTLPDEPGPALAAAIAATLDTATAEPDGESWLLKLSTGGGEHLALAALTTGQRRRFTHLVVQLHWLTRIADPAFREALIVALEEVNRDFTLCHVHANNHVGLGMVDNLPVVDVVELTYVRTELIRRKPSETAYPTYLDCASNPESPDHLLSFFPFHPSPAPVPDQASLTTLDNALLSSELVDRLRHATGLPTTSLRIAASTRVPLPPDRRVLRPLLRRRVPKGARLAILYFGCHLTLDYDDLCLFTAMGHTVFCLGDVAGPQTAPDVLLRPNRPEFYPTTLWQDFHADPGNDLPSKTVTPAFAAQFDLAIVNHDPQLLDLNREALAGMPIIFRSIGQATEGSEACLARHVDTLKVVRYSPREVGLPGFCRSDRVIYFAKDLADYPEWRPGGDRLITFHNAYPKRPDNSVPTLPAYQALAKTAPLDLYGYYNEGIPAWRGLASPETQLHLFRTAGVYFYVYSAPPSYTLSLIEALLVGTPTVVPSARAVRTMLGPVAEMVGWVEQRYEVEDFVGNDPALIWDTIEEGHAKARVLLQDRTHAIAVSQRLRTHAVSLFDRRIIAPQWQSLFDEMVPS